MSKERGKKIGIRFTQPLIGDVGAQTPPIVAGERLVAPGGIAIYSASDSYSTNTPELAFDGSTSTYWQTRAALPQWLQIDLQKKEAVTRFRYYSGGSYRVKDYSFEASNDSETWVELWSGENEASTGWRDISFVNTTAYRYYRFVVDTGRTSGRIYFYEAELYAGIGNERAFTIKGMEKDPLFAGELQEREYAVDKVERYPVREWWRDDQDGDMDDVEILGSGISLKGTPGEDELDIPIDVGSSSASTANWVPYKVYYYKNKVQFIILASELATKGIAAGTAITALSFKVSSKPTRNLNNFRIRIKETEDTGISAWHTTGLTLAHYSQSIDHNLLTVGTTYKHEFNADITEWSYQGDNLLIEVSRDDTGGTNSGGMYLQTGLSAGRMVTSYYDSGYSYPFDTMPIRTTESSILETTIHALENEYGGLGIYAVTLPTIPDPAPRLRFTATIPEDTSITAEYACTDGAEPDTWIAVDDQDVLDLDDDFLWLRFTLATEDDSVTPILEAVWLEQATAPPDTILLTMTEAGRFNNVDGDLTVIYDATQGTLAGTLAVESFNETFEPEDLVPSIHHAHTIDVTADDLMVDFWKVVKDHAKEHEDHTITATATDLVVDFVYVEETPP